MSARLSQDNEALYLVNDRDSKRTYCMYVIYLIYLLASGVFNERHDEVKGVER